MYRYKFIINKSNDVVIILFNMNLRFMKQRASHSETHAKKSDNSIQLSQYFSRSNHNDPIISSGRNNNMYYDQSEKQNKHPNIGTEYKNQKQNQREEKITPKKKVIHLRSITRNSKSNKNANSGSIDKKYSVDHHYTQVTDFADDFVQNRPSIRIDIDLKSHRKSMQDTLVSSKTLSQLHIRSQEISCCNHYGKKATFIVKGSPYCDKCSVKLITKGFVAVKIHDQRGSMRISNSFEKQQIKNQRQNRDFELKNFIEQLDKMQPILQSIGSKITAYTGWMAQYCTFEYDKFEQNWDKFIKYLQDFKKHMVTNFKAQQQKANKMLQENKIKIKEQTQKLSFMRNDIVRNIDRIINENIIRDNKYSQVMNNFKFQLEEIHQNVLQIQKSNLILPRVQFDSYQLDQQLHKFLYLRPFSQQLFSVQNVQTPSASSACKDSDPYRLSFGKESERMQSPTFKVI